MELVLKSRYVGVAPRSLTGFFHRFRRKVGKRTLNTAESNNKSSTDRMEYLIHCQVRCTSLNAGLAD